MVKVLSTCNVEPAGMCFVMPLTSRTNLKGMGVHRGCSVLGRLDFIDRSRACPREGSTIGERC